MEGARWRAYGERQSVPVSGTGGSFASSCTAPRYSGVQRLSSTTHFGPAKRGILGCRQVVGKRGLATLHTYGPRPMRNRCTNPARYAQTDVRGRAGACDDDCKETADSADTHSYCNTSDGTHYNTSDGTGSHDPGAVSGILHITGKDGCGPTKEHDGCDREQAKEKQQGATGV